MKILKNPTLWIGIAIIGALVYFQLKKKDSSTAADDSSDYEVVFKTNEDIRHENCQALLINQ